MKRFLFLTALLALNSQILTFNSVAAASPTRPNILWLIGEDFSPHLGCYGTKEVWTPNLDKLAADGMRYTRAFTTAPPSSPPAGGRTAPASSLADAKQERWKATYKGQGEGERLGAPTVSETAKIQPVAGFLPACLPSL